MLDITLLIADDEEELIENLKYDLEKSISKIIVAENGEEALKKLKSNKVDCVLADINMPGKNGLVFAKEAREWGYQLPIMFLTAHGDDHLMKNALSLNAFDFIDKPYEKKTLLDILQEAASESKAMQKDIARDETIDSEFKRSYLLMLKE
ncbi:MAG: response regulator [Bacteriovoracales bacterium]|nr:response regulator [Bacteriovoracales bacterium]